MTDPRQLWLFLPLGYLFTIAIETPILLLGLSRRHSLGVRLFSGVWLTACTYPIVVLVMPLLITPDPDTMLNPPFDFLSLRGLYLIVAETFAPVAECALFWTAFGKREERWTKSMWQDLITITVANLASFLAGEAMHRRGWL